MSNSPENCPLCGVSLLGDPIPQDELKWHGDSTHWKREIGIERPEIYDGVFEWKCPDCLQTWPSEVGRFTIHES